MLNIPGEEVPWDLHRIMHYMYGDTVAVANAALTSRCSQSIHASKVFACGGNMGEPNMKRWCIWSHDQLAPPGCQCAVPHGQSKPCPLESCDHTSSYYTGCTEPTPPGRYPNLVLCLAQHAVIFAGSNFEVYSVIIGASPCCAPPSLSQRK